MKTVQAEGLIACAWPGGGLIGRGDGAGVGRILFTVELSAGQLRYVFDDAANSAAAASAAARPLLINAGAGRTLNDNRWHDVGIAVVPGPSTTGGADLQHTVHVDNTTATDWLPRSSTSTISSGVGPVIELFVGGVTPGLYHSLPKQVSLKAPTVTARHGEAPVGGHLCP